MPDDAHVFLCPLSPTDLAAQLAERVAPPDAPPRSRLQQNSPFEGDVTADGFRLRYRSTGMQTRLAGTLTPNGERTAVAVRTSPPAWLTSVAFAVAIGGLLAVADVLLGIGAALASAGVFVPLDLRNRAAVLREFEQLLTNAAAAAGTTKPITVACERCGEPLPLGRNECPMCGHDCGRAV